MKTYYRECSTCKTKKNRSESPLCRRCYLSAVFNPGSKCVDCGKRRANSSYKRCASCFHEHVSQLAWMNIENKIKKTANCWIWTGSKDGKGYGRFRSYKRMYLAHRLIYERYVSPIPRGKLACHTCDNRLCCNPKHIFIGGTRENAIDAISKEIKFGRVKLRISDVNEIRNLYKRGETIVNIAKRFGVSDSNIQFIVKGKTWKFISMSGLPSAAKALPVPAL